MVTDHLALGILPKNIKMPKMPNMAKMDKAFNMANH
jgi:hypothetical protein